MVSLKKILTGNGGEFTNTKFITAEAPWSNRLRERHNLVFADMLNKVLDGTQCHPDLAVSWCINAKNSLHSVHGFSPYQLATGKNPKLASVLKADSQVG